jgi:hypothetical protein
MDLAVDNASPPLHLEVRTQPKQIIYTLILIIVGLVTLYLYIGRVTLFMWVMLAAVPIVFIQAIRQIFDLSPCLVINEEGVYDKRLRMGTSADAGL